MISGAAFFIEGGRARGDGIGWRANPYSRRFFNTTTNQSNWMWWHTGWNIRDGEITRYDKGQVQP